MTKYLSMNKEISFSDAALASPASSYTSSPSASLTTGTRSLESSFSSLGTTEKGKSARRKSVQAAELEQEEAEIDLLLGQTRPKHILEGCASGVGYILAGAIGACGILVLSPHVGSQKGYQTAGVAGVVVGAIVGTAIGTVQATGVVAGGIVSGVSQMIRGIASTPRAIVAPRNGKWWNANEGEWVLTHIKSEQEWLEETQPKYDEDILGEDVVPEQERDEKNYKKQSETTAVTRRTSSSSTTIFREGNVDNEKDENDNSGKETNEARAQRFGVKETTLYDLFGVDPDASVEDIQRRYGQISRMYSAQRAGADPEEARAQFQSLGNAYVILTNQILRDIYNEEGTAGIYGGGGGENPSASDNNNKNGSADGQAALRTPSLVNPIELSSILYGSQKFAPYIGRLAAATNCYVCRRRQQRITLLDARRLQKRRVTRLALQLADRLEPWVVASRTAKKRGNKQPLELVKEEWRNVARELCQSNNGIKLVHLIGSIYSLTAAQFLGSMEAGIGIPRIHRWAKKQRIAIKSCNDQVRHKIGMIVGRSSLRSLKEDAVEVMKTAQTSSDSEGVTEQLYKEMGDQVMELLWTQTAIDVANTIHEAAQMVLFDQDKNADTRRYRGKGLEVLGQIFQSVYIEQPDEIKEAEAQYEKIVFFAVLDSVRRLEIAARDASFVAKQMDNAKV